VEDHDLVRVEDLAAITGSITGGAPDLSASGFVVGPASAADNRVAIFDGTTGKLLKSNSNLTFTPNTLNTFNLNTTGDATFNRNFAFSHSVLNNAIQDIGSSTVTINYLSSTVATGILPSAGSISRDLFLIIKDVDGVASSSPIVIDGNGSLIDGETQVSLVNDYESISLAFDINFARWSIL
jgi:hypothetical protein